MVHKDKDIRREYDRNKKREMRAAAKLAIPTVQVVVNLPEVHITNC